VYVLVEYNFIWW